MPSPSSSSREDAEPARSRYDRRNPRNLRHVARTEESMKTRLIAVALVMLLALVVTPFPAEASPYDLILCPMVGGEFVMENDQLWIDITKEDGKAVEKRREKIANPLDAKSHEVLAKRGRV